MLTNARIAKGRLIDMNIVTSAAIVALWRTTLQGCFQGGKSEGKMKGSQISARLVIELIVTCPNKDCSDVFDLFDEMHGLNDEGELIKASCPDRGLWSDSHKDFKVSVKCPECGETIAVKGIEW